MKKLILLISVIMAMLLSGCAPETVYIERDSDDKKTSSKDYSDEYEEYDADADREDNTDNNDRNSGKDDETDPQDETMEGETIEDADNSSPLMPGEVKLSKALTLELPQIGSFKIKSYIIAERYGDKIITLKGNYTNLYPDYDQSLGNLRIHFDVYQDDIRLNVTSHDNDIDLYTDIKTNKTIEASCSYVLRTETDDIEIIGTDYNDVEYVVSFPIK